jgi:ribonucleoside-diphosphate reductase alpha chain
MVRAGRQGKDVALCGLRNAGGSENAIRFAAGHGVMRVRNRAMPESKAEGSGSAGRKRLPDERKGVTHHFVIANFDGYITVGEYENGMPGEVFVRLAKTGSTLSGLLDAFAIMFSIALQYGAPLQVITDKLSGMRFDPAGFSQHSGIGYARSVVDYIARWMALRYLPLDQQPVDPPKPLVSEAPPASAKPKLPAAAASAGLAVTGDDGPPCARCGNIMQRAGSSDCWVCANCGASVGGCGG